MTFYIVEDAAFDVIESEGDGLDGGAWFLWFTEIFVIDFELYL